MTKTISASASFARVRDSAERIKSDAVQRFPEAASVGDTFRQGDVYIERIAAVPAAFVASKRPSAQLAPGTTQGSRHILDSLDGVTVLVNGGADVLTGPVLVTTTERTITHPEHGDVVLPPGWYAITYQRAYAEELRRVAD